MKKIFLSSLSSRRSPLQGKSCLNVAAGTPGSRPLLEQAWHHSTEGGQFLVNHNCWKEPRNSPAGLGVAPSEALLWILLIALEGKGKTDCSFGYLVFPCDKRPDHGYCEEFAVPRQLCFLRGPLQTNLPANKTRGSTDNDNQLKDSHGVSVPVQGLGQ